MQTFTLTVSYVLRSIRWAVGSAYHDFTDQFAGHLTQHCDGRLWPVVTVTKGTAAFAVGSGAVQRVWLALQSVTVTLGQHCSASVTLSALLDRASPVEFWVAGSNFCSNIKSRV